MALIDIAGVTPARILASFYRDALEEFFTYTDKIARLYDLNSQEIREVLKDADVDPGVIAGYGDWMLESWEPASE